MFTYCVNRLRFFSGFTYLIISFTLQQACILYKTGEYAHARRLKTLRKTSFNNLIYLKLQTKIEPKEGFEPTTYRLQDGCSTTELL